MIAMQYSDAWEKTALGLEFFNIFQTSIATMARYANAFTVPFIIAANYFNQVERQRFWERTPEENLLAYLKLSTMNMELAGRAFQGDMQAINQFMAVELHGLYATLTQWQPETVSDFAQRMQRLSNLVAYAYPEAIEAISGEFGFHFERQPDSSLIDETDRFLLYQVLPTDPKVKPRADGKPILIVPPFVLGANILAFLPLEKRSYAHAFANQGVPTFVRVVKNIQTSEAVQLMTPEDDAKDTRRFCESIKARYGVPLTLNGYCQGGYTALCNLLSGELDGLVDALITCVAPMDGSRGKGLADFLKQLPDTFNDLIYGTKTLPNGNQVTDGTLMGWIYKLKSIETETPLLSMWRDMMLLSKNNGEIAEINKTAAALNYWLMHDRKDLALNMTRVSFDAYTTTIGKDGTLPVRLFGKTLNLKRIHEKRIPWLLCYGKQDDLVEPAAALAPADFVPVETMGFPKGHVAMATSWSHPDSAYALHLRFPDGSRGPVRFQLDLQEALDQARKPQAIEQECSSIEIRKPNLPAQESPGAEMTAQQATGAEMSAQQASEPDLPSQQAEATGPEEQVASPAEETKKRGAGKPRKATTADKTSTKRSKK